MSHIALGRWESVVAWTWIRAMQRWKVQILEGDVCFYIEMVPLEDLKHRRESRMTPRWLAWAKSRHLVIQGRLHEEFLSSWNLDSSEENESS